MSITDDIVAEIVKQCKTQGENEFTPESVFCVVEGYTDELVEEIEKKLKAKGIEVK